MFSANLKTRDKATQLGIVWNYIPEEAIKKSWITQMFWKRGWKILAKYIQNPAKYLRWWFLQR